MTTTSGLKEKNNSSALPLGRPTPALAASLRWYLPPHVCEAARLVLDERGENDARRSSFTVRSLVWDDMDTIKALHREWFPIEYREDFFVQACNGTLHSIVLCCKGPTQSFFGGSPFAYNGGGAALASCTYSHNGSATTRPSSTAPRGPTSSSVFPAAAYPPSSLPSSSPQQPPPDLNIGFEHHSGPSNRSLNGPVGGNQAYNHAFSQSYLSRDHSNDHSNDHSRNPSQSQEAKSPRAPDSARDPKAEKQGSVASPYSLTNFFSRFLSRRPQPIVGLCVISSDEACSAEDCFRIFSYMVCERIRVTTGLVPNEKEELDRHILEYLNRENISWRKFTSVMSYIMTLGVLQEFRGKGLAMYLVSLAKNRLIQTNQKVLYLHVVEYNESAVKMYQACGFILCEKIPQFYQIYGEMYSSYIAIWINPAWNSFLDPLVEQVASYIVNLDQDEDYGQDP